jgi:hypothetical protein
MSIFEYTEFLDYNIHTQNIKTPPGNTLYWFYLGFRVKSQRSLKTAQFRPVKKWLKEHKITEFAITNIPAAGSAYAFFFIFFFKEEDAVLYNFYIFDYFTCF